MDITILRNFIFYSHLDATVNADKFKPDLIIYNAGTDILKGDMLGKLSITEKVLSIYFENFLI